MKEWWNNLSLKDKRTAAIGSLVVVIALFYALIWLPLSNKNALLRTQVEHNKQLLAWMQEARVELQNTTKKPQKTRASGSLLSIIQDQMNQSVLAKTLTQLKQVDQDSVALTFQTVNFDDLITWLTQIGNEQGITVAQISVTPIDTLGTVSTTMTLQLT